MEHPTTPLRTDSALGLVNVMPSRTVQCPQSTLASPGSAGSDLSELSPVGNTRSLTPVQAHTATVILQSTPIKLGLASQVPFSTNQRYCIPSCNTMADKMKHFLVGPMPAQAFLNNFLPEEELLSMAVPYFYENCYQSTLLAPDELHAYKPFVSPFLWISPAIFTSLSRFIQLGHSCPILGLSTALLHLIIIPTQILHLPSTWCCSLSSLHRPWCANEQLLSRVVHQIQVV